MLKQIRDQLKELNITNYLLREERKNSVELFFIRRRLDMRRIKDVSVVYATVYRDFDSDGTAMRGSSAVVLSPDMSAEEQREALLGAYAAAENVRNPMYELYQGEADPDMRKCGIAGEPLTAVARTMTEALFSADADPEAFLNSAELFVERSTVRIVSSSGTDVSYEKTGCNGEFVAQCKEPRDVEQHSIFSYESADADALRSKVAKALETVRDRAHAEKAPVAGTYDLILSGEHIAELLSYYLARANAQMVFAHYSDYRPGTAVQGDAVTGERLNLTVLPDAPWSGEGVPMPERALITDGVLKFLHGPVRFCRYLGTEPTGDYDRIRLDNGTIPFDSLKRGCLWPVSFSDFQMDDFSGHFGGEIRLAYLFTEDGVEILTGGSVNGSLIEKQGELTFSTERFSSASYEGPFAVRIPGVRVAGKDS